MRNEMPINVNAASAVELDAIPALAGHGFEIVRYREERGWFSDRRKTCSILGGSPVATVLLAPPAALGLSNFEYVNEISAESLSGMVEKEGNRIGGFRETEC